MLISMSGTRCGKHPVPSAEPESSNKMRLNPKNVCSVKRVVIVSLCVCWGEGRYGVSFRCLKPSPCCFSRFLNVKHRDTVSMFLLLALVNDSSLVTSSCYVSSRDVSRVFPFSHALCLPPNFHRRPLPLMTSLAPTLTRSDLKR